MAVPLVSGRVRARGLVWDVIESDTAGSTTHLLLRCAEGDLVGLEHDLFCPPDCVEPVPIAPDPAHTGPLALWRLMHLAHLLDQQPEDGRFVAGDPGQIEIEPYQLVPAMRALDMPRPRLMLADGVGLGKTIQAGLIAVELIARRRAHRILIAAPAGPLLTQWEREMRVRFGLRFTVLTGAASLLRARRAHGLGANPFDNTALCLTSIDFAKQDHVLEELERSNWDLAIIDEAHHCAAPGTSGNTVRRAPPGTGENIVRRAAPGTGENTMRRRLAEVLASRSDGLLLLTATPHDGHDAHFASLLELLDPSLVDGIGGLAGHAYRRHVVRRLKTHIRDPRTGAPLFRRRHVVPVKVDVEGVENEAARNFHRALSAFAVPRVRAGGDSLAFVSLLKRSVSTIAACLATLRVVAERLAGPEVETRAARAERARALRAWRRRAARHGVLDAAGEAAQEALEIESMADALGAGGAAALAGLQALGHGARDPKLAALAREVRLIRLEWPRANILIYT